VALVQPHVRCEVLVCIAIVDASPSAGVIQSGKKRFVSPLRYLKPSESLSEIVAGLIMVLTFTLAASVLSGGGQDGARAALLGAIGCNAAWGIIDAVAFSNQATPYTGISLEPTAAARLVEKKTMVRPTKHGRNGTAISKVRTHPATFI